MHEPSFARLTQQFIAELRMCDVNQRQRAFADCFAVEIGHAIFGYDIVNIPARRDDASTWFQQCRDAGSFAVARGGGQRNDWFASHAACCAANEIKLPAKTAVET